MKAEDLDVLNILVGEDSIKNKQFTGKIDPASSPGHTIYVAQEVRDWQMGHLTLLGLSSMVPGYPIVGGTLESYTHSNRLMAHAMDAAHRSGRNSCVVTFQQFTRGRITNSNSTRKD